MLTQRLIICLDVKGGRVVKGTRFVNLRDVGDPIELAARYEEEGADEITFLDISASSEERSTLLDIAQATAERLTIPLTIGGGIRSAQDVGRALRAGADKVSINSAAVSNPSVISDSSKLFGAQCVIASIDAKMFDGSWKVHIHGGKTPTELDAVEWARQCVDLGAGEILLTSIDRDGARIGYDIELTSAISAAVNVPVIASGGAGNAQHVVEAFTKGGAEAALVAGIVHDGITTVSDIKAHMKAAGLNTRELV